MVLVSLIIWRQVSFQAIDNIKAKPSATVTVDFAYRLCQLPVKYWAWIFWHMTFLDHNLQLIRVCSACSFSIIITLHWITLNIAVHCCQFVPYSWTVSAAIHMKLRPDVGMNCAKLYS